MERIDPIKAENFFDQPVNHWLLKADPVAWSYLKIPIYFFLCSLCKDFSSTSDPIARDGNEW
jgi:hypothetical protein